MPTHYRIPALITLLTFLALLIPASPAQAVAGSGTVITVDTLVDDGENGTCSLREAVRAANTDSPVDACPAGDGADTILLAAETYNLSIVGVGENYAVTGDLDILEDLVIRGMGMDSTFVDGGGIDRVFHILWPDLLPEPVVRFERLTIRNGNVTTDRVGGAGILNEYGTLTLHVVSLEHNYSYYEGVEPAVGGGMDNLGTATLINSNVSNNGADDGGGIFNGGTLSIYRSTLNNNIAIVEEGGALDNLDTATLEDVTISGNSAPSGSGGGIFSDGTLWIYNTTLSGNTASESGGALVNGYVATVENVTISGNSAASGGGIYNAGSLDVTSSTIVENSVFAVSPPADPKGANIENKDTDTVQIKNSMIAKGLSAPNCAGSEGLTSKGHNLEDTDTCNFVDSDDLPGIGDPSIDVLADYGGPTWTHALLSDSPAIDQGDDLACPTTDQRGANRVGEHCDIGAYEYDGVIPIELVFLPIIVR